MKCFALRRNWPAKRPIDSGLLALPVTSSVLGWNDDFLAEVLTGQTIKCALALPGV